MKTADGTRGFFNSIPAAHKPAKNNWFSRFGTLTAVLINLENNSNTLLEYRDSLVKTAPGSQGGSLIP